MDDSSEWHFFSTKVAYILIHQYINQTNIGNDTFVIYLQIYVDATHVTAFGNVKYWGVFLWVGNVPKADRNGCGGRGHAILIKVC